jgi:glutamate-ammonia-ligase adenylyltransferase
MFDLKQGRGALVDIEFLMQALVLEHASACPRLLTVTNTVDLIETAEQACLLSAPQSAALRESHMLLLARSLAAKLDARPRMALRDAPLEQCACDVLRIARELDLAFD